jgi:large subunit ribosomal protein L5
MTLRALSGETENGGGRRGSTGVQIVRGVKSVGGWVRPGLPVGAKVDLLGSKMYVDTLTEFVLPRLREFPGLLLPPSSSNLQTPAHAI